jgi:hypothetical protein
MLKRLLPVTIDNTYRGHTLGLWLLALVVAVRLLQILSVMIDGPGILASADGIPLHTFGAQGAQTAVAAFIGMGISRLLISIICGIVLLRYRSVVTALFALLVLHDIARELVLQHVRTGTPIGPVVNRVLLGVTLAGLALSVWSGSRKEKRVAQSG